MIFDLLCVLEGGVVAALALHSGDVLHFGALVGLLVHVVVRLDVRHAAGVAGHSSVVGLAGGVGGLTFLWKRRRRRGVQVLNSEQFVK